MLRRVSESGAVTATVLSVSTALHRQEAGPMRTRANGGQDFQMLFLLPHGTLATAQRGGAQRQMGMRGLKRARGKWCHVTMARNIERLYACCVLRAACCVGGKGACASPLPKEPRARGSVCLTTRLQQHRDDPSEADGFETHVATILVGCATRWASPSPRPSSWRWTWRWREIDAWRDGHPGRGRSGPSSGPQVRPPPQQCPARSCAPSSQWRSACRRWSSGNYHKPLGSGC